jgi:hypothetical protein
MLRHSPPSSSPPPSVLPSPSVPGLPPLSTAMPAAPLLPKRPEVVRGRMRPAERARRSKALLPPFCPPFAAAAVSSAASLSLFDRAYAILSKCWDVPTAPAAAPPSPLLSPRSRLRPPGPAVAGRRVAEGPDELKAGVPTGVPKSSLSWALLLLLLLRDAPAVAGRRADPAPPARPTNSRPLPPSR